VTWKLPHKPLRVEPLSGTHDRDAFTCGVPSLDAYLKTQATQDLRRKANAIFVLVDEAEPGSILGYFTLCAFGLSAAIVPEQAKKHIPRYPVVSATLLGRLAVCARRQGQGIGSMLLAKALKMALENASVVGSCMVVVDAIDESAASFYEGHGFIRLQDSMRLILPMRAINNYVTE
jgi:GNAT superfamily N-acetyltransferase